MNNLEKSTNLEKEHLLLTECFIRLNSYYNNDGNEWDHPDDILMRINDEDSLTPEFFLRRIPIELNNYDGTVLK